MIRRRRTRVIPFLIALTCFLLPFAQVSCKGGPAIATVTGVQLTFGSRMEVGPPEAPGNQNRVDPQGFLILAFVAAALGALCAAGRSDGGHAAAAVCAVVGLVGLFCARVKLANEVAQNNQGTCVIEFLVGFTSCWVALLAALVACGAALSDAQSRRIAPPVEGQEAPS